MIYGDAFRPAPSFSGMLGPIQNPGGSLNLQQAGRDLYGGANKAAGLAGVGAGFLQGMSESRKKSAEAHEEGMRQIMALQQMFQPPMGRPQQMPVRQFGGGGDSMRRLGRSFFASRGGY